MRKCTLREPDESGWIPLHYAAHLGDVELVKLFLENDKSLAYIKDKEGMSALHISAKEGHVGVMKVLIHECPDTCELFDNKNRTALHLAVESGKLRPVRFLLRTMEFQNLINEQDEDGNTALHLAATRGYVFTARLLSHYRKVDRVIMNKEAMTSLDILLSITPNNVVLWLIEAVSYV